MRAAIGRMGERKTEADVVVVGGGVIGLAIALEIHGRGARVIVVERGEAMRQASSAAAGMLAVDDPGNAAELLPLARLSVERYPGFLRRIETLSGVAVPFQTETAWQYGGDGSVTRLAERSIDPRQLGAAMVGAMRAAGIVLMERSSVSDVEDRGSEVRVVVGEVEIVAKAIVYAAGAWTAEAARMSFGGLPIGPRKGQMLRVRMPEGLGLKEVHRSEQVYVVPRTAGPQAGTALIGATVEDVGFDVTVHAEDLTRLRGLTAELVPELLSEKKAPLVEAWAGLRPATPDGLPVIAAVGGRRFVASGHYRNGVLLAPATAAVMADLITGETPSVEVGAFSAERFSL